MSDPWLEAARHYSALDERARTEYWSQLSAEQQQQLSAALARGSTPSTSAESVAAGSPPSAPRRSGAGRTILAGCIGMVLGSLLTIAVIVVAVAQGVSAVGGMLGGGGGGSSSSGGGSPSARTRVLVGERQYSDDELSKMNCFDELGSNHSQYEYCMRVQFNASQDEAYRQWFEQKKFEARYPEQYGQQ